MLVPVRTGQTHTVPPQSNELRMHASNFRKVESVFSGHGPGGWEQTNFVELWSVSRPRLAEIAIEIRVMCQLTSGVRSLKELWEGNGHIHSITQTQLWEREGNRESSY